MSSSKKLNGFYIGLMSGTSCDGIDTALVSIDDDKIELVESYFYPFDNDLRKTIIAISNKMQDNLHQVATLDTQLGNYFSLAVKDLLKKTALQAKDIIAIGSHGQTIRHEPNSKNPYTTQIGDANIISYQTGITTVADFRRKDIAAGGQGAPLVPAFHANVFKSDKNLAIVNIGGMANITLISSTPYPITGFDTGPGNVLMDYWCHLHKQKSFDVNGAFAQSGKLNKHLLKHFLSDDYFSLSPPKSTGREYFNKNWLEEKIKSSGYQLTSADIQNTLAELTAVSILRDINQYAPNTNEVIICGGGAKNAFLMTRLKANAKMPVVISDEKGIKSDWIEAMAFAWLAKQTLAKQTANIPSVTGAEKTVVLGAIYPV